MTSENPFHHPEARRARYRRWGVIGGVALAHAGLFALLGLRGAPPAPPAILSPIEVELFEFASPPPPPPPPDPESAADPGGGAPAAASRVNRPPDPPRVPPELPVAPPTPAPEPTLILGASETAGPEPGLGQGGEGSGTGSGTGSGDGPGAGSGPIILRGASNGEILAFVPPEARRRRVPGRASVNCVIRADTRLEACRPVDETPQGLGFGEAAVRIAETHFRFRPPTTASGRPVEGFRVTVFVQFGRQ